MGDFVEIECPSPDSAPRKLVLFATQAPHYAKLRLRVNGQKVAVVFDGYANSVQPRPAFPLGVFTPRDGKFTPKLPAPTPPQKARNTSLAWTA